MQVQIKCKSNETDYQKIYASTVSNILVELVVIHWEEFPTVESNVRSTQFLNESHDFHSLSRRYLNSEEKSIQNIIRFVSRLSDQ